MLKQLRCNTDPRFDRDDILGRNPDGSDRNKGRSALTPKGCERVASGEKGSHPESPTLKSSPHEIGCLHQNVANTHPHAPGAKQNFRAHRRQ